MIKTTTTTIQYTLYAFLSLSLEKSAMLDTSNLEAYLLDIIEGIMFLAVIVLVPAGSTSNVPADCVSAGHVHIPADRDRIC
ncbi:hypothetical protein Tco_0884731 [Tanacetum coccineum]